MERGKKKVTFLQGSFDIKDSISIKDGAFIHGTTVVYAPKVTVTKRSRFSSLMLRLNARVFTSAFKVLYLLTPKRGQIYAPPGRHLFRFADFFFSKRTNERILQELLRDMQEEYNEALATGRPWKARWVHIRGTYSFWKTVGLHTFVKLVHDIWVAIKVPLS